MLGTINHNIQAEECKSLDQKKKVAKSTWKEFSTQNQIQYMKSKIDAILQSKGNYVNNKINILINKDFFYLKNFNYITCYFE